jgi:hypothetical protein
MADILSVFAIVSYTCKNSSNIPYGKCTENMTNDHALLMVI